ncbi:hypothetical protein ACOMHN_062535 [Nucella lapillus]
MLVPSKAVYSYPNNKPWLSREVADVIKQRLQAFQDHNTEEVERLQKETKKTVQANKRHFRGKVENNLASNNTRQVWTCLQTMTGYKPGKRSLDAEDHQTLANDLNAFYGRFDITDFSRERAVCCSGRVGPAGGQGRSADRRGGETTLPPGLPTQCQWP